MTLRSVNSYLPENPEKNGFPDLRRPPLVCDQNAADPSACAGREHAAVAGLEINFGAAATHGALAIHDHDIAGQCGCSVSAL